MVSHIKLPSFIYSVCWRAQACTLSVSNYSHLTLLACACVHSFGVCLHAWTCSDWLLWNLILWVSNYSHLWFVLIYMLGTGHQKFCCSLHPTLLQLVNIFEFPAHCKLLHSSLFKLVAAFSLVEAGNGLGWFVKLIFSIWQNLYPKLNYSDKCQLFSIFLLISKNWTITMSTYELTVTILVIMTNIKWKII